MLCAHEIRGGTDGRGRAISRCTGMRERECRLAGGVGWAERESVAQTQAGAGEHEQAEDGPGGQSGQARGAGAGMG